MRLRFPLRSAASAISAAMAAGVLLALLFGVVTSDVAAASPDERRIDSGRIAGSADPGVSVFRAVPFAAPPLGALSWRAPEPAAPWVDVRGATAPGASCIQRRVASLEGGGVPGAVSEDCLTLDVYTPVGAGYAQRRPVMVWIHGGGLVLGGGGAPGVAGRAVPALAAQADLARIGR